MIPSRNRQVVLKSRPGGIPQPGHFELTDAPLRAGELLLRTEFLSVA